MLATLFSCSLVELLEGAADLGVGGATVVVGLDGRADGAAVTDCDVVGAAVVAVARLTRVVVARGTVFFAFAGG